VRIVTGDTRYPRIVRHDGYLGESCRPGVQVIVAERTKSPVAGCRGQVLGRVIDMLQRRFVTNFARYVVVIEFSLDRILA
jgi:hypothetical protein